MTLKLNRVDLGEFIAIIVIIFALLLSVEAFGQTVDHDFGLPIYWDANSEPDVDEYGVFRAETTCTDPVPSPLTCPSFSQVATVSQGPDPIQWTEPGPITFVQQDYIYRVTARNTSGLESIFSDSLTIRWLNPNAPGKPGGPRTTTSVVFVIGDGNTVVANFYGPCDECPSRPRIRRGPPSEPDIGGILEEMLNAKGYEVLD